MERSYVHTSAEEERLTEIVNQMKSEFSESEHSESLPSHFKRIFSTATPGLSLLQKKVGPKSLDEMVKGDSVAEILLKLIGPPEGHIDRYITNPGAPDPLRTEFSSGERRMLLEEVKDDDATKLAKIEGYYRNKCLIHEPGNVLVAAELTLEAEKRGWNNLGGEYLGLDHWEIIENHERQIKNNGEGDMYIPFSALRKKGSAAVVSLSFNRKEDPIYLSILFNERKTRDFDFAEIVDFLTGDFYRELIESPWKEQL